MKLVVRSLAALTAAAALAVAASPAPASAAGGDHNVWCLRIAPGTNGPCPFGPPPTS